MVKEIVYYPYVSIGDFVNVSDVRIVPNDFLVEIVLIKNCIYENLDFDYRIIMPNKYKGVISNFKGHGKYVEILGNFNKNELLRLLYK